MGELTPNTQYQAAWSEHGVRITQRQNAVQIYLATAAILLGFYFKDGRSSEAGLQDQMRLNLFMLLSITFLTVAASMIIWMHHRVMQHLCAFMQRIERQRHEGAAESARMGSFPAYFYEPDGHGIQKFHAEQRKYHRIVLAAILGATNGAAVWITYGKVPGWLSLLCVSLLHLALFIPFFDLYRDRRDD